MSFNEKSYKGKKCVGKGHLGGAQPVTAGVQTQKPQQAGAQSQTSRQAAPSSGGSPSWEEALNKFVLASDRRFEKTEAEVESLRADVNEIVGFLGGCGFTPTTASAPAVTPAPAPAPAPTTTTVASAAQSEVPWHGPGHAYRYWDWKSRTWCIVADLWAAKQAGNGIYDIVWVWYQDGAISRLLSDEEIRQYTP